MDPTTRMYVSTRFYLFLKDLKKRLDMPYTKITELIADVLSKCEAFEKLLNSKDRVWR